MLRHDSCVHLASLQCSSFEISHIMIQKDWVQGNIMEIIIRLLF